jgi:rSAM/selenodomain-associated transferase 2
MAASAIVKLGSAAPDVYAGMANDRAMISVIVPTLDEAERLPALLMALACERAPHEVIVVDGGSRDRTPALAAAMRATVLAASGGRGAQLAAGAAIARGDVLLFLHADSRFPAGGLAAVAAALRDPAIVGGNFRLLFDGGDDFSRWLDGFYAWIRAHGVYYGDSGIFVRRTVYAQVGSIRPIALMEDYDFVRRLEGAGRTACITEPPLVTSSRRFAGRRPTAIVAGWLVIHALYFLGVDPATLARLYRSDRRLRQASG